MGIKDHIKPKERLNLWKRKTFIEKATYILMGLSCGMTLYILITDYLTRGLYS